MEPRAAIKRRLQAEAAATGAKGVADQLLADRRADLELDELGRGAAEA